MTRPVSRHLAVLAAVLATVLAGTAGSQPAQPGMTTYVFGLLRKGPSWTAERNAHTDSIQAGHMANIGRMASEGSLVAAGPMGDPGDLRGIFVFRSDSIAAVRADAARDPAIASGRLTLDLLKWVAPRGIGERYRVRARQPGHKDSMVTRTLVLLRRNDQAPAIAADSLQRTQIAHVQGIFRMLASGELAGAGPFLEEGDLRGILVFRCDSTEARRLTFADAAVRAGQLSPEIHPWWVAHGVFPNDTVRAGGRAARGRGR